MLSQDYDQSGVPDGWVSRRFPWIIIGAREMPKINNTRSDNPYGVGGFSSQLVVSI